MTPVTHCVGKHVGTTATTSQLYVYINTAVASEVTSWFCAIVLEFESQGCDVERGSHSRDGQLKEIWRLTLDLRRKSL